MQTYLGMFVLAAMLSLLLTPLARLGGAWLKVFGPEAEGRERPVIPRLGGLPVLAATALSGAVSLLLHNEERTKFLTSPSILSALPVPLGLIVLLGLYDDVVGISARRKLTVQALAAGIAWWGGIRITSWPFFGYEVRSSILSFALTVLWLVAVTNSLNLIDGADGLAGGIGILAALSVFVVCLLQENQLFCIITVTLAGALLGFLKFNFPPATIYLGDVGSLSLGFILGALAILASAKSTTLVALTTPYTAFSLPLLDTALAVARRFLSGRSIFARDQNHIHHQIHRKIRRPRVSVLVLYALALICSLGSFLVVHFTGSILVLAVMLTATCGGIVVFLPPSTEPGELVPHLLRDVNSKRRVMANPMLIRGTSLKVE